MGQTGDYLDEVSLAIERGARADLRVPEEIRPVRSGIESLICNQGLSGPLIARIASSQ